MISPPRPGREEILRRAEQARASLARCELCAFRCGADRTASPNHRQQTPCGLGVETRVFKRHVSFAEEIELLPSYMVYFAGCNFRCRFCVQGPTCFSPQAGVAIEPAELARECASVVTRGARTVNLLGGEPSLHLHTVLAMAAEADLPIAFNSNMYLSEEALELLDGLVAVYVADLKFGNDDCALRIAGAPRYREVVEANLLIAARQAPIIVRHLLMPGHLECCLRPVAKWVARHLPQATFTLMTSYVPAWRAATVGHELGRSTSLEEAAEAEAIVRGLGLRREGQP